MRSLLASLGSCAVLILSCGTKPPATVTTCATGTYDLNSNPNDGCEYACTFVSDTDPFDDAFIDENCDGSDGNANNCIYVEPTRGVDSTSGGSRANPLKTVAYAIPIAGASAKSVCLAAGTYQGPLTVRSGVSVYGGFDGNANFVRGKNLVAAFTATETGIIADGITAKTELAALSFKVTADTPAGSSAYGLRYTKSTGELALTSVSFDVGAGRDGATGSEGAAGATGADGNDAAPQLGVEGAGGRQKTTTCGGAAEASATGGAGGNGGAYSGTTRKGDNGNAGSAGGGGATGGAGGTIPLQGFTDCSTVTSTVGGNGAGGSSPTTAATVGTPAPVASKFDANCHFQNGNGGNGERGSPGGGGGGGGGAGAPVNTGTCGSVNGGGGGGGAAGGCGGEGGSGGKGGGASIAICATGGTIKLVNTLAKVANGGKGSDGVKGGSGGNGGTGGAGNDGQQGGGKGGKGGSGAKGVSGSAGGGGAGGVSACATLEKTVTYTSTNSSCVPQSGGAGGATPGGATAAGGTSAVELRW